MADEGRQPVPVRWTADARCADCLGVGFCEEIISRDEDGYADRYVRVVCDCVRPEEAEP